jgi:hypothetical protein
LPSRQVRQMHDQIVRDWSDAHTKSVEMLCIYRDLHGRTVVNILLIKWEHILRLIYTL